MKHYSSPSPLAVLLVSQCTKQRSSKERSIKGSTQRPPIPFADYCRIFNVISCVIADHTDIEHGCILFAMIGADILRKQYRLPAKAVSGAAVYCLGSKLYPLVFGANEQGRLVAAPGGFHSWIECKGYAIDLLAPLFRENVQEIDPTAEVPRRVFMKPLSVMSQSMPQKGDADGTFLLVPDQASEENMLQSFHRKPAASDLQDICNSWYRRPPKKIPSEFSIRDDRGKITTLTLQSVAIGSFW